MRIIDGGVLSHDAARGAYMPSLTRLTDGVLMARQCMGWSQSTKDGRGVSRGRRIFPDKSAARWDCPTVASPSIEESQR